MICKCGKIVDSDKYYCTECGKFLDSVKVSYTEIYNSLVGKYNLSLYDGILKLRVYYSGLSYLVEYVGKFLKQVEDKWKVDLLGYLDNILYIEGYRECCWGFCTR